MKLCMIGTGYVGVYVDVDICVDVEADLDLFNFCIDYSTQCLSPFCRVCQCLTRATYHW